MKTLTLFILVALLPIKQSQAEPAFAPSSSQNDTSKKLDLLPEEPAPKGVSLSTFKVSEEMKEHDVIEVAVNQPKPLAPKPIPRPEPEQVIQAPVTITPQQRPVQAQALPTPAAPTAPAVPAVPAGTPPAPALQNLNVPTAQAANVPPPQSLTISPSQQPATAPRAAYQYKICQGELPPTPEVAVILSNDKFYPNRVKLIEGLPTRLMFATTNRKPAALIIEKLKVQRWIAKEPKINMPQDAKSAEINRELVTNRVTEITLEPRRGSYQFHDAVSGATGELVVE